MFKKTVDLHYGCDSCASHGEGETIPPTWQFLIMQPSGQNKIVKKALLCPGCATDLGMDIKFHEVIAKTNKPVEKPREEKFLTEMEMQTKSKEIQPKKKY